MTTKIIQMKRHKSPKNSPTIIDHISTLTPGAAEGLHVGIVVSVFNSEITDILLQECLGELNELGVSSNLITVVKVPGALEIPQMMQFLVHCGVNVMIALGAVVRGDTYHFEIVSDVAAREIAIFAREYEMPVANGVLTTNTVEQALERAPIKARECARTVASLALTTADLIQMTTLES